MSFIKEFWEFLKIRKKYWLLPIIIVLVLFGGLIILSQGSCSSTILFILFFNVPSILGISAFYHDSAACILKDGEIIAAAQEERLQEKT
jgi:hypothetical protein